MSDPRVLAQRERLWPILNQLDEAEGSTFLDLCELVLMLSERVDGSIKWEHPRVTVHIKQKRQPAAARNATTPARAEKETE